MINKQNLIRKYSSGQVMILTIVFSAILLSLMAGLIGYWMTQIAHHRQSLARTKALNIAEAGVEMALWKLNNQPGYNGEVSTFYGEGEYNVTITELSSTTKLVRADAFVPNATSPRGKRSVQLTLVIGTTNVGFNYGVQVGDGGLEMANSSQVVGNVYSDGDIIGTNSARIQGTAIAAGTSIIDGMDVDNNAQAHTIRNNSSIMGNATVSVLQNSTVGGNLQADSISSCTVGGSAVYDTRTSCTIDGTATSPNPNAYFQAPVVPLPITEEQIDGWEDDAESGGSIGTQSFSSGSRSLGPVKINGDLILSNTAELIITGTIWVTGQLSILNQSILKLSPGYGGLSGMVLVGTDESPTEGFIDISNNTEILGSGTAGSYLMLLSQKEGFASTAIRNNNTGVAAILYAGEGTIELGNSAAMKEVTAGKLVVANTSTVTYETGLANTAFTSGPGGGWEVMDGTWQLVQ
ncbi:MAG: hypothetical protein KW793_01325 [Candidatus Doudnabacteria bacterium]|nr:hypothetical protein [Candidatus Doudnabacteria bacterium]